jgi:hypothetical protein
MDRQNVINSICGGVIGYSSFEIMAAGNPILGVMLFIAWVVALANSLIPVR